MKILWIRNVTIFQNEEYYFNTRIQFHFLICSWFPIALSIFVNVSSIIRVKSGSINTIFLALINLSWIAFCSISISYNLGKEISTPKNIARRNSIFYYYYTSFVISFSSNYVKKYIDSSKTILKSSISKTIL